MPDLARRQRLLTERLYENEALRDGLDDDAAAALLDWMSAGIPDLVKAAADLDDDDAADEAISPRLKAQRKLIRHINQWVAAPDADPASMLDALLTQAATLYGPDWTPPDPARQAAFAAAAANLTPPATLIHQLRELLEPAPSAFSARTASALSASGDLTPDPGVGAANTGPNTNAAALEALPLENSTRPRRLLGLRLFTHKEDSHDQT